MEDNSFGKEIRFIAAGVLIGDVIMCIIFLLLGKFSFTVILGALIGSAAAVGSMWYLGKSIDKALEKSDNAQAYFRRTYFIRMLLHAAAIAAGAVIPQISLPAVVIPMFFPRICIYVMQLMGKYKPGDFEAAKRAAEKKESQNR